MDLKLTEHVRNTIPLIYKQTIGWNTDIWNFFSKKINFSLNIAENRTFQVGHVLLRRFDVIRWPIFVILVSIERGGPNLYYGFKQLYFGSVSFKFTGGGNHTHSGRRGSGTRGLKTIIFRCSKNNGTRTRETRLKFATDIVDPISLNENLPKENIPRLS